MVEPARIGSRCSRIARTLEAESTDEIALLRTARILKRIHDDLERALRGYVRAAGWSPVAVQVEASLAVMQQDLRHVLLNYLSLDGAEVHRRLVHALGQSRETLALLDG